MGSERGRGGGADASTFLTAESDSGNMSVTAMVKDDAGLKIKLLFLKRHSCFL